MCHQNETSNCLSEILHTILCLQDNRCCQNDSGCDKPYLGPSPNLVCYNTRPFQLSNCYNGSLWTFPYTLGTTTGTSSILRICNLDETCATCLILAPNPDTTTATTEPYVSTNRFVTIQLDCVSSIKCLADTYVSGV